MHMFKRGMIFVTFFGSCIAIALLVASLGTKHWVSAAAKRTLNPHESNGRINYGLFAGKKDLNVAYGWRSYDIDVLHLLKYEPEFLIYGYWIGTVICVSAALLSSILAAMFAVISAATSRSCFSRQGTLYLWNILSFLFNLGAIGLWIAQFYLRIQSNVLSREDLDNSWTSEGMADLGYSFWFIVGAAVANFVDVMVIYVANSDRKVDQIIPMIEEKTNGAIMLY